MKVAKWGNSLAIRIPRDLAERMGLREGDDVSLTFNADSGIELARNERREEALEWMRQAGWTLPPGYKFDREEANAR